MNRVDYGRLTALRYRCMIRKTVEKISYNYNNHHVLWLVFKFDNNSYNSMF